MKCDYAPADHRPSRAALFLTSSHLPPCLSPSWFVAAVVCHAGDQNPGPHTYQVKCSTTELHCQPHTTFFFLPLQYQGFGVFLGRGRYWGLTSGPHKQALHQPEHFQTIPLNTSFPHQHRHGFPSANWGLKSCREAWVRPGAPCLRNFM
jgi:hypothetical protein